MRRTFCIPILNAKPVAEPGNGEKQKILLYETCVFGIRKHIFWCRRGRYGRRERHGKLHRKKISRNSAVSLSNGKSYPLYVSHFFFIND